MKKYDWVIRSALPSDTAFIYSTWTHSYRYGSGIGKSCRNSVFFNGYHQVIDWILSRPMTSVILAVLPDEPDVVLSYLVYEPDILHYTFTKEAFRNMGIATSLMMRAGDQKLYTHKTFMLNDILNKYPDEFTYDPFILFHKGGDVKWQ